ncbi:MAG: NrtA/SsuA/CpmA family ABC transporter substrate-binding protein [Deltaproteobacteria bacterium]|nr:NrtA/SsuA/CpmA family ABC transporter substrate-binding protein [Deltaproteobacteria bacterium]
MSRTCSQFILATLLAFSALYGEALAQEQIMISYAGFGGFQAPIWAAKDLELFEKHGLNAEVLMIPGGSRSIQALLSGAIHFQQGGAPAVISAVVGGADVVMVATALNKFPYSIVAQKEIRKPSDLQGKKIGIVNFGGSNELAVVLALKEWGIPRQSVTLMPAGEAAVRLVAVANGALDATILSPPETLKAAELGMSTLAHLGEMKAAFPQIIIGTRRSFLQKNRETVKRFMRAYTEGIYELRTNKDKAMKVYAKRLRQTDTKVVEETCNYFATKFSFPPRLDREGLRNALSLIPQRSLKAAASADPEQYFDESVINELEKEGFFAGFLKATGR